MLRSLVHRVFRTHDCGILLGFVICVTTSASVLSAPSPADVQSAVTEMLTELHQDHSESANMEIEVARLDPRLRLKTCEKPLEAFLPPSGKTIGHITVGLRCPGPTHWKVFTSARVGITKPVVVAARQLQRGRELTPSAVKLTPRDLGTIHHGYIVDLAELKGMRLRRRVSEGTVLSPSMLEPKPLVQRGDHVTLRVNSGGVLVSAAGEVLSEASAGQLVRARNISSDRVVQGHLGADRVVQVVR
jgi:flagella basal body P-ring formation protein FlgA